MKKKINQTLIIRVAANLAWLRVLNTDDDVMPIKELRTHL